MPWKKKYTIVQKCFIFRVYTCMDDKADQLLCKELSKKDWISFLLNRAKEMKPGLSIL